MWSKCDFQVSSHIINWKVEIRLAWLHITEDVSPWHQHLSALNDTANINSHEYQASAEGRK